MHILYLFPEPLPLPGKARAIQVVKTVSALAQAGAKVTLAYVADAATGEGETPFTAYGMSQPEQLTLLPLSRRLPGLPFSSGWAFVWRLCRWLREQAGSDHAPEVILMRHIKLAYRLLRNRPSQMLAYEAHELFADTAPKNKAGRMRQMESAVLSQVDRVWAISGELARRLSNRYGLEREMPVLPSATDLPQNLPQKDWEEAGRRIVYAGSLYGWKGVDDLVAAAALLPEAVEITLLGGDEVAVHRLRQQQASGGAHIHFLGQKTHVEVMRFLAQSCIAILPNRAGSVSAFTSPLKLFEYMASGCALVVSDLPVFREILAEEDAAWFAAGDVHGLAAAIRRCLENPVSCQLAAARLTEQARAFTWQARAEKILSLCAPSPGSQSAH